MRRLWPTLIALLGLTLLAAPPASAAVAASIENRTSESPSGSNNLIGIEARLSEEAVREKLLTLYELASDDAVAARGVVGGFKMTETVAKHAADVVTKGPFKGELARPFLNSPLTIGEIRAAGKGIADPGGVAGALRWDVPGAFRGSQGTWELVMKDDLILHFNFVGK